jgi:hypothetical protein
MKFQIKFGNPSTGKTRTLTVALTKDEIASARAHPCSDICAEAYALRRAYSKVPGGFQHFRGEIKPVWAQ